MKIDLSHKQAYFIGIKGVGMTMLAQFLKSRGWQISGSDVKQKFMTDSVLKKAGLKIFQGFSVKNLPKEQILVVYSTAYTPKNNSELKRVTQKGWPVLSYAELLSKVFNQHKGLAVVGSHGKTTVTAWLGYVLKQSSLQPNVMVGANVQQFPGNSLIGKSDWLVIEADEYQNKLKYYQPQAVVLNNIDYDHPDFFPSRNSYEKVFVDFIKKIPNQGFLVANYDDEIVFKTAKKCLGKIIFYSLASKKADLVVDDIFESKNLKFSVHSRRKFWPECLSVPKKNGYYDLGIFQSKLLGEHNISNALAVIATSLKLGVDLEDIRKGLKNFKGTSRRLELLGKFQMASIYDDYAHHPAEVKATLSGLRKKFPQKKIRVFFNPHTFSRTQALLKDFSQSFSLADEVVLLDIYSSAREKKGWVTSQDLLKEIEKHNRTTKNNQSLKYLGTKTKCRQYIKKTAQKNEIIVLMGAGDVFEVAQGLV